VEGLGHLGGARVVEGDVQPAVVLDGAAHERLDVRGLRHVRAQGDGLAPGLADQLHRLPVALLAAAGDDELRAMTMAVARPIPELAPVTRAILPSSCFICHSLKMATAATPSFPM
jgi:hypothetical protein